MQSQWWRTKCWPKCNWGDPYMAMAATRVLFSRTSREPSRWLRKGTLLEQGGALWSKIGSVCPSVEPIYPTENFFATCTCHLPLLKLMFVALSMRKDYLRAIFGKFQDCTIGCFHHQVQWRHQMSYGSVSNEIFVRLVIQCHFRARWSGWKPLRNIESHEICVRQLQIFFQTYTKIGQHHFSIDHMFDKTSHACNFLGKTGIRTKVCTLIPMPSAKSCPVSDLCASINEPDTFAASTSIVRGHRIMAFKLGSTFSIAAAVAKGAAKFLVLVLLLLFLLLLFFKWKIYHKKKDRKILKHVWNSLASIVTASAGADLPFGRPQIWR